MTRLLLLVLFCLSLDLYVFFGLLLHKKKFVYKLLYISSSLLIIGYIVFVFSSFSKTIGVTTDQMYGLGVFLIFYVPKLFLVTFFIVEDGYRLLCFVFKKVFFTKQQNTSITSRRTFVKQLGACVAAIPFTSLLYGVYKGRYNFRVVSHTLYFEHLPDAFDGYQITQLSDFHSGSFDDPKKIDYAIDLVNKQQSDVIFFTGDIVNNKATELEPWVTTLARLQAKDGIYSVLGNHDYGDYVTWPSLQEKQKNMQDLKHMQKQMGFTLLCNNATYIEKATDKIAIIGVENWGAAGFKQIGDIDKAIASIAPTDFKIVLSHDPTHWQHVLKPHAYNFDLTLSGHTHGMQFGIEIPGWVKWSPIAWKYKYWAGMYQSAKQYLYVNRGFGYLGYPGRVGMWPEITTITLKKKA